MVLVRLPMPGCLTKLDYSRARTYFTCSRWGWGLFGNFSLVYHSSLSLGDSVIPTEILSQRAIKPKPTNHVLRQIFVSFWDCSGWEWLLYG